MAAPLRMLIVVGETSGDHLGAAVLDELRLRVAGLQALGIGGSELVQRAPRLLNYPRSAARMGLGRPLTRALSTFRLLRHALELARSANPRAVLLVGYSEFNSQLLRRLPPELPTLWLAPPQVWAWRPGRAQAIATRCNQLAVTLPFERDFWQRAGAQVTFVGHPSMTRRAPPRPRANSPRLALLPGSRDTELRAHLDSQLAAARTLLERGKIGSAQVILAADTPSELQRQIAARAAEQLAGVTIWSPRLLESFDVAAVASGTASLDCMAAGVPIVIGYRTDWLTFSIATRLVTTPWIGLPNLVLGKAAFPELVQSHFNAISLAQHLEVVLDHHAHYAARVADVQGEFEGSEPSGDHAVSPAARVASLMMSWL